MHSGIRLETLDHGSRNDAPSEITNFTKKIVNFGSNMDKPILWIKNV